VTATRCPVQVEDSGSHFRVKFAAFRFLSEAIKIKDKRKFTLSVIQFFKKMLLHDTICLLHSFRCPVVVQIVPFLLSRGRR